MVSAVYWAPAGSDPLDSSLWKNLDGQDFTISCAIQDDHVLGSESEKKEGGCGMVTFDNLFREGYDQYNIRFDGNVASVQALGHSGGSIQNMTYHVLGSESEKKEDDDVASLDQVREDLGYTGFTGQIRFTESNKKEDKMALTFWDSLKLVSPEVGEQFETEQEYRDAVVSAGAFLHASESLDKLDAVYGSGEVCDGIWDIDPTRFVHTSEAAEDAYGPDGKLYKKNTEESK